MSGTHDGHDHAGASMHGNERAVGKAFILISTFTLAEVLGGLWSNSLTLLADAGHMFLDSTALGLTWYALRLSRKDPDHKLSYGYHRFQVLAACLNGLMLLMIVGWILFEALQRISSPQPVMALPALAIAVLGLVVNIVAFRWLHGHQHNTAVRSALLHVLGDLLGSVAAITSALVIHFTGWFRIDSLLAMVVAAILAHGAWRVLRESSHILLEGVPPGIDLEDIRESLTQLVPGVVGVHHVHAWALTSERPLVTLHAHVADHVDTQSATSALKEILRDRYGVEHSTIQVERGVCLDEETPAPREP